MDIASKTGQVFISTKPFVQPPIPAEIGCSHEEGPGCESDEMTDDRRLSAK
ncbi:MAG: hypothetical protein K8R76_01415 [Candidatus Aegiribacteria sp.]|nr:hypothetical protein [Candidatus Aegiribacteria sp.]